MKPLFVTRMNTSLSNIITIASLFIHIPTLHRGSTSLNHSTERDRDFDTECLCNGKCTGTSCAGTGALAGHDRFAAAGCLCLAWICKRSYCDRYADGFSLEKCRFTGVNFVADGTADGESCGDCMVTERADIDRTNCVRCGKREADFHFTVCFI